MKRLDQEPTTEVLLESIHDDRAGRNRDIVDFIKMLNETEGPYAYMIDSPWGDGKTFFVKSVQLVLSSMNPSLEPEGSSCSQLEPVMSELATETVSALPFYFNAWSNDFADDPISAIFASMAVEFRREGYLKQSGLVQGLISIVDAGLAVNRIPINVSETVKAFTGEDLVKAYHERREIRARISQLCEEALPEVADRLVIFIDELDRCRPDFAVRLLEQTKNLFASDRVILVFSADSSQLAKAVGGMYGNGFDTQHFLERFFDERVMLSPVDSYAFTHDGLSLSRSNRFDELVAEMMASRVFTIRDQYRVKKGLESARNYCMNHAPYDIPHQVAACTVLPLLVFIRRDNIDLFRVITSGEDYDALFEYGKRYASFISTIKDAVKRQRNGLNTEIANITEEDCKAYMHDLCMVIYGSERFTVGYSEARQRLGDFMPEAFNEVVYKRLKIR